MARKPAGPKVRPLPIVVCIACIVLLAGTVSPAFGGPTAPRAAANALKTAKRAFGLAKKADARSKQALAKAGQARSRGPARCARLGGLRRRSRSHGLPRRGRCDRRAGSDRPRRTDHLPQRHPHDVIGHHQRGDGHRSCRHPRRRRRRAGRDHLLGADHGLRIGAGQKPRRRRPRGPLRAALQ